MQKFFATKLPRTTLVWPPWTANMESQLFLSIRPTSSNTFVVRLFVVCCLLLVDPERLGESANTTGKSTDGGALRALIRCFRSSANPSCSKCFSLLGRS